MSRDADGSMDREILLTARGVSKSFGAVRVLHEVSFDVRRGEVLGILAVGWLQTKADALGLRLLPALPVSSDRP